MLVSQARLEQRIKAQNEEITVLKSQVAPSTGVRGNSNSEPSSPAPDPQLDVNPTHHTLHEGSSRTSKVTQAVNEALQRRISFLEDELAREFEQHSQAKQVSYISISLIFI